MDFSKNYLVKLLHTDNEKYKFLVNNFFFMELQIENNVILTDIDSEEELDFKFNEFKFLIQSVDDDEFSYLEEDYINWNFQIKEVYDDDDDDDEDEDGTGDGAGDGTGDGPDVPDEVIIDSGQPDYISEDAESFIIEESLIEIVGVIDKITELSRWEKQYSTKEYIESIVKSLKNVYKRKNLIYIENKAHKLLNFILKNCEDIAEPSNKNYKIKENIIIPTNETYLNRSKYYSNNVFLQGIEFYPYNFTTPETLVLIAGGSVIKIKFTENVNSIETCIGIINKKKI